MKTSSSLSLIEDWNDSWALVAWLAAGAVYDEGSRALDHSVDWEIVAALARIEEAATRLDAMREVPCWCCNTFMVLVPHDFFGSPTCSHCRGTIATALKRCVLQDVEAFLADVGATVAYPNNWCSTMAARIRAAWPAVFTKGNEA